MLLVLLITSKGMGAVPRGSLVVVAATLDMFHLPSAGLLLVLGVDQFLDMGRSATNVVGNGIATVVVAHWEGENVHAGGPDADEDIAIRRPRVSAPAGDRPRRPQPGAPTRRLLRSKKG